MAARDPGEVLRRSLAPGAKTKLRRLHYNVVCRQSPGPEALIATKVVSFLDPQGFVRRRSVVLEKVEVKMSRSACSATTKRLKNQGVRTDEQAFKILAAKYGTVKRIERKHQPLERGQILYWHGSRR